LFLPENEICENVADEDEDTLFLFFLPKHVFFRFGQDDKN
jgi:hypothetical protein